MVRCKLPIWILVLILLCGCNGKMNRKGVGRLLQQATQVYEQGRCGASLRLLDSIPQLTDNQFQLLQADLLAMHIYITTAANEDFCRRRNSALMRMQMINEERASLSSDRIQRYDSLALVFHLYSCLYYRNVHIMERAETELAEIRSREVLCPDTALRIRSRLVSAGDSVSLRDYITWCRHNNRWSLEGELLMHEARYAITEHDTLTAILDAEQANQLFEQVGNPFLQAGSLCFLAHIYTGNDAPAVALEYLNEALDILDACAQDDSLSTPLPLLASIREELSVAYAALGEKPLSDYNRNIYLDILDLSRQDKETESRYEQLQQVHRMNLYMLLGLTLIILLLIVSLYLFHRIWNRRIRVAAERMESTSRYCHALLSGEQVQRPDEVIVPLVEPYEQWARSRSDAEEQMEEQRIELEEQLAVLQNKKVASLEKNIEKRSQVGVLEVMMPNIERLCHTVNRLRGEETNLEELESMAVYASELSDCIYDYNEILGNWIKLQRGEVALRTETFSLQTVFDELSRAAERYESEGLTLIVEPTDVKVKADNALTFFMLNTLSENARKFTPAGGNVTVSVTEATDTYAEISVTDTGIGISPKDVETLMNEKVYDSSTVGQGTVDKSKKGHGFGIMNCKGIIHKYLKSGSIFSVCMFGVESEPGKGSRFYFRLPRVLLLICALLFGSFHSSYAAEDALSQQIESLTDSCYYSNIRGTYEQTIAFADSVLRLYNLRLEQTLGHPLSASERILLRGDDHETASECAGVRKGYNIDYNPLLSIRNEVSVAALAMQDLPLYSYNNEVYQDLYHLLSQDRKLDDTCERLDSSNHNIHVWCILMVLILIAIPIAFYFLLIHSRMLYRFEVARMMDINRRILALASKQQDLEPLLAGILQAYMELEDMPGVALYIPAAENRKEMLLTRGMALASVHESFFTKCIAEKREYLTDALCCFPLIAFDTCVGAIVFRFEKSPSQHLRNVLRGNTIELLSHLLYHALTHHSGSVADVETLRNNLSQLTYEEYRLYTENMILDNCLSTVKHETMYYPALVRRMLQKRTEPRTREDWQSLYETVDYYRRVFNILCTRAHGQMEYGMLRPVSLTAVWVEQEVRRVCKVCNRKRRTEVQLQTSVDDRQKAFLGDTFCVTYLLRLCVETLHAQCDGTLTLRVEPYQKMTKIVLGITAGVWNQDELDQLFYPAEEHIPYLIMRQIVRLHDDFFDYRGCRIVAQARAEGGYEIWFTLVEDEYGKI